MTSHTARPADYFDEQFVRPASERDVINYLIMTSAVPRHVRAILLCRVSGGGGGQAVRTDGSGQFDTVVLLVAVTDIRRRLSKCGLPR